MTQEEINKRNNAIAKYLGYVHIYQSIEDFSDVGGLETRCIIYSKVPLKVNYSLDSVHWKKDREQFMCITVNGYDVNPYMNDLKYNKSWDWLMPVVEKIEEERMNINIQFCEVSIFRNATDEKKYYYGNSKLESVFLAVSDYCMSKINH